MVNLDVSDEIILSRISDRWVHLPSGRVYNLSYNPPKIQGHDDLTGEPLIKRPDDSPVRIFHWHLDRVLMCIPQETFARRLAQFYASTAPLLSYYATTSAPRTVNHNSHQHPHQLAFHPPSPKLKLRTLTRVTSDENWPHLDALIRTAFPGVKERIDSRKTKTPALSKAVWAGKVVDSIQN